ncbi:MAG TPA: ATP-binding protein [Gemmatimonadaceae bacterium]|nr:ATP-binding protein [Gemmatimonadaceae bacterium]
MSRIRLVPSEPNAIAVTQGACVLTVLLLVLVTAKLVAATMVVDVLLCLQFAGAAWVFRVAARRVRGTRRALYVSLAAAAALALVGRGAWTLHEIASHGPAHWVVAESLFGIAVEASVMVGLAVALGRYRHRNWMRFEAMVDALLLISAVAIVIVQLDAAPPGLDRATPLLRTLAMVWNTVAAANLILVALLLVWRGEALGGRLATGLSLGAVALALSTFLSSRALLVGAASHPGGVAILWALGVLAAVTAVQEPRVVATEDSVESPTYASDAAKVRTFSIVIAILIASLSAASLSFRGARSPALGVALAAFGVLLALRAGYALLTQQRTTMVLEHAALAERELSTMLEQRVNARTAELAEAHRVMQRMWTLGQQIALELTPERVLQRFIEAAMDVMRADGGAVGLVAADRVQIAITAGLGASLAGRSLPATGTAMGRVVRTAESWWTEDATRVEAEEDLPVADGARAVVVLPLQRRGECIGAIALFSRRTRRFTESEVSHVEAMADLLSVALANADLLETLRKAEWRFRTLFRAAPDAVFTVFESGRIREANDAVREVLGRHPLQVVGRTLEEFVVEEEREGLRKEFERVLAGAPARMEVHLRHEGGLRTVSLAARLLPETDPPMVLFLGRDMTAEREMRARLAETERLAAVGELVAGVAHEVNNPLCTISAFAQLLERDGDLEGEQREAVEVICSETLRASQVLRDLLTFARRSESETETIQVNDIVERTMRLRSYEMTSLGVAGEYELGADLPFVKGDSRQLQQVLLNLVTNAMQAMESMGSGKLRIITKRERDRVVMEVTDTGPGIPAEARAHVFEPFFTTKRDGTGLGLSVSYGIVAAHGGMISIARSGPEGTTFRVSLPALEDDPEAAEPVTEAPECPDFPLAGVHMLFVDDELALHAGIRAFARTRGFTVVAAPDGAAALDAARRENFDVVVCDIRMSGLDGPAFFEVLRREHPDLAGRTLFITGDLVSASSRAFIESVRQPVLAKPFDLERLEQAVATMLKEVDGGELVVGTGV